MDQSSIIEKISHLRKLAASTTSVNEAATAFATAEKLILKYQIAEEDIKDVSEKTLIIVDDKAIYQSARIIAWKHKLAIALSKHFGCAIYISKTQASASEHSQKAYKLVGQKKDIDLIHYMNAWLSLEIERLTKLNAYGKGHVYAFSYAEGAVAGILLKMEESKVAARQEAVNEGHSSALVRLDSKLAESSEFMNNAMKLTKSRNTSKRRINDSAYYSGVKAGSNINFNKVIGS